MLRGSAFVCVLALGCSSSPRESVVQVQMDYTHAGGFYSAPFPSDALKKDDGHINLLGFPNPNQVALLGAGLQLLSRDARGFALAGAIFFSLDGALEASPDLEKSVFLVAIDEDAKDYMVHRPIDVTFVEDGGPSGAANLLALLPYQGVPLRPHSAYAAVVLNALRGHDDLPLKQSAAMHDLLYGRTPEGMNAAASELHQRALRALAKAGVYGTKIAAFTAFTTDDPVASFQSAVADALALPLPTPSAMTFSEEFAEYCVYNGSVDMPVFQEGTSPFSSTGGRWATDPDGHLVLQGTETARLFVTIPKSAMPTGGYPVVVTIRTGAGADRALVDRGIKDGAGNLVTLGSGPALQFARAGWAGISADGPIGGPRNTTMGDEQFLVFNVFNPPALRDNVRQQSLEVVVLAHVLDRISVDTSACAGATNPATLNSETVGLMGHSMGASIAPLALAVEPKFRLAILSGAGGSWIANAIDKLKPLAAKPSLETLFGYTNGRELTYTDPVLTLVQWAPEAADVQVFARHLVDEPLVGAPRNVLMFQGIVNHYIMPRIANTLTLAAGLDLAGAELDITTPELDSHPKLRDVLAYSGRKAIRLPAQGNRDGFTAVVVQHREDGVEDGHEVMWQLPAAQAQYRRFLESYLNSGAPEVIEP